MRVTHVDLDEPLEVQVTSALDELNPLLRRGATDGGLGSNALDGRTREPQSEDGDAVAALVIAMPLGH